MSDVPIPPAVTLYWQEREIERLTAELEEFKQCYREDGMDKVFAERDRLRAALERIAVMGEEGMRPDYTRWVTFHDEVARIARAALAVEAPVPGSKEEGK